MSLRTTPLAVLAVSLVALTGPAHADPYDAAGRILECTDSRLQEALRQSINTNAQMNVRTMARARTTTRDRTSTVCAMHVVATSGLEYDVVYTLTLRGSNTDFLITEINAAPAPGTPAPPAPGP